MEPHIRRRTTTAIAMAAAMIGLVFTPRPTHQQSALERYMAGRASHTSFGGVVLVVRGHRTLLHEAYGMANYDLDTPNTVETVFRIGSLTKPITAVTALRLVDRGVLDLARRVCEGVMRCPSEWNGITVRHLLSHTSGLPDLFSRHTAQPVETAVAGFDRILFDLDSGRADGDRSADLEFEPGTQYAYNNFNYVFLAYLMEKATGQHWEDLVREQVLDPAGMTSTRYDRVYEIVHGRARGYRVREGRMQNTDYDDHEAYAAGGLLSTATDLRRFIEAAIKGELLRAETRAQMLQPGLGDYGLGWQIVESYGRTLYNHTGSIGGFASYVGFYPQDDLLVIVLSNVQNEPARGTGCDLAGLALGEPVSGLQRHLAALPARPDQVDPGALGPYVGAADSEPRAIRVEGDGAVAYVRGQSAFDLLFVAPDSFTVAASRETLIRLTRTDGGAVAGFTVERCGGVVTEARKVTTRN